MMIRKSAWKKILKRAYGAEKLRIAATEDDVIVSGGNWWYCCPTIILEKDYLAEIVKYAGHVPENGVTELVTEYSNQIEIENLAEKTIEYGLEMSISDLMCNKDGRILVAYRNRATAIWMDWEMVKGIQFPEIIRLNGDDGIVFQKFSGEILVVDKTKTKNNYLELLGCTQERGGATWE